jgi:hypothetical protein
MLNTILTKIPGVASAKDSFLGMVVKPHVQEYLGDAGTIQDIRLDSMAKTIEVTVILQGDPTPLVAKITSYSITERGDYTLFSIQQWECRSHPWLHTLGQRFSPTAEIPLPVHFSIARNLL